jgi:hypothetical protein
MKRNCKELNEHSILIFGRVIPKGEENVEGTRI